MYNTSLTQAAAAVEGGTERDSDHGEGDRAGRKIPGVPQVVP